MKKNSSRNICGHSISNNEKVDLIGQIVINNSPCNIYVGACSSSGIKPHYHILSSAGELLIGLEDKTSVDVIQDNNWYSLTDTIESLELWLLEPDVNFSIFSNRQYVEMLYNVNNPSNTLPIVQEPINIALPNDDENCYATIFTTGVTDKDYIFVIEPYERTDFEAQFKVGDDFESNTIIGIAIT